MTESFFAVTRRDVDLCAFDAWYTHFATHAYRCRVLVAPSALQRYLESDDGLRLGDDNNVVRRDTFVDEGEDYDDDDWHTELAQPVDNAVDAVLPADFSAELTRVMNEEMDGKCFVKLNWSAPRDAAWLLGAHVAPLQFSSVDQILVALKGSDFIAHDLAHRYDHCVDHATAASTPPPPLILVLKPWRALRAAGEFRCFVFQRRLIAVTQRHGDTFFRFLIAEEPALRQTIGAFFAEHVVTQTQFALESFVCDVYVASSGTVRILDIGPFGRMTDAILFSWDEIAALCQAPSTELTFRIVETEQGIRPSLKSVAAMPYDLTLGAVEACDDVDALVEQLRDHIDKGNSNSQKPTMSDAETSR
jgi:hypothetical protein